jgi:hypothetical protein
MSPIDSIPRHFLASDCARFPPAIKPAIIGSESRELNWQDQRLESRPALSGIVATRCDLTEGSRQLPVS